MKRFLFALAVCGIVAAAQTAMASLMVTNGDFEADPVQTINVTDWYDTVTVNTSNWWETTWAGPNVSPDGTPVLGLSYMFDTTNWAYQSIGTNDSGALTLALKYDVGSFTDAGGDRDLGVVFSVYQNDGATGMDDNVDLAGLSGATLLDSVTTFTGAIGAGVMLTDQMVLLDISGSAGKELFLRLENAVGTVGQPWTAVDNIRIAPEPASLALVGLGGLALLAVSRRRDD